MLALVRGLTVSVNFIKHVGSVTVTASGYLLPAAEQLLSPGHALQPSKVMMAGSVGGGGSPNVVSPASPGGVPAFSPVSPILVHPSEIEHVVYMSSINIVPQSKFESPYKRNFLGPRAMARDEIRGRGALI